MKKSQFIVILLLLTYELCGQYGYVKFDGDSTLKGYLRFYRSSRDGHQGIEIWKTKRDKNSIRVPKTAIIEYAIKKDTFKVFHKFTPFHNEKEYFEIVDANLISNGRVKLYGIVNYEGAYTFHGGIGGSPPMSIDNTKRMDIYVLESKDGFLKALPRDEEDLETTLLDFFPERYLVRYKEVKGKIMYNSIPKLVKLYNSK